VRNATAKLVVDVCTQSLKKAKDPCGGRVRAVTWFAQIYKICKHNNNKSLDIHLDSNPYFEYKKYEGTPSGEGVWKPLGAGYDITGYPDDFPPDVQRSSAQVLTLCFASAAAAEKMVKGMRVSGLVPVSSPATRAAAPTGWHYKRAQERGGRAMIGRSAISSKNEGNLLRLQQEFNELFSWCSLGSNADKDPSTFFRMPCAQCGKPVTVFRASQKNNFFPLMCFADGGEHEQEEHVLCTMINAWEQDTPCSRVCQEGTQNDCPYVPQGHNTEEEAVKAMAAGQ
jgi:hypothetical protein